MKIKINSLNDFNDRIKWNIFHAPQFEISLFEQEDGQGGAFWDELLQIPDWDKLRTIEEKSEGYLFGLNSKDTLTKDLKPLTPLMVESIIEPIHEQTPIGGKKDSMR